jgi:hypothetical protein
MTYSQIGQDDWVVDRLNHKRNGTFVDIGCACPFDLSNTALLEINYGWRGIGVDLSLHDNKYNESSREWSERKNTKLYLENATTIDYEKCFIENNMPSVIDYLSIDLEPPTITFEAFKKLPHEKYKFRIIHYEQDAYRMPVGGWRGDSQSWLNHTREYICSLGYNYVLTNNQDDYYELI